MLTTTERVTCERRCEGAFETLILVGVLLGGCSSETGFEALRTFSALYVPSLTYEYGVITFHPFQSDHALRCTRLF